jgi:ubiquinone/menaquinone biosynthesis C-methylase UbiE
MLDLGCGVGRHALLFAEHGFAVEAIDGAAAGLDFTCREAAARSLRLNLRQADADALPFADESFDYVLSWNVIFHGTMGDVGRRIAEIWRVLKRGGLYQGTVLSKRDVQFGRAGCRFLPRSRRCRPGSAWPAHGAAGPPASG